MRITLVQFCFGFLLFFCIKSIRAQQSIFQRYTMENGLQNNIVFAATQDAKNLMWFATSTGIDRFDGNKFTPYLLPINDEDFTENLQIQHIVTGAQNQIWAASSNAIFLYNVKKDLFELPKVLNQWLEKNKNITHININNDSTQLLITTNTNVAIYNSKTQTVKQLNSLSSYNKFIFEDKKGMLWIGTNKGLLRAIVNEKSINLINETLPIFAQISNSLITHISQDELGKIWIATNNQGLYLYDEQMQQLNNVALLNSLRYAIKDIYHQANTGNHYISLDGGGVIMLNKELKLLEKYETNEDDNNTISSNAAYDIFNDRFNRIWVTTYGSGINLLSMANTTVRNFYHQINNKNSLSNNAAKAITQSVNGDLWFGTRKGISVLKPSSNTWIHFNEENSSGKFVSDNVLALCTYENEIYVGTYGGGLMRINANTNAITNYKNNPNDINSIGTDYIYALLTDSKGRIWVGGMRGSLSYFDKAQNKFFRIESTVIGISSIIEEKETGNILCATEKGVFIVKNNKLENYFPYLKTERVISLLEYTKNNFWIGTLSSGIIQLNTQTKKTKNLQTANGLPSNVIGAMLHDQQGDVWIGTSKGLAHYKSKSNIITAYSKADGLAGSQINYGAIFLTNTGQVVLGTTDGFSLFDPLKISNGSFKPNLVFTNLIVNNKLVKALEKESPLTEQLDELDKLVLKSNQNSISIDFVNSSPANTGKHLYSWKLEGFDNEWSQPSSIPTAVYTNLPSGNYVLLVKAFAKGQVDNAQIRKLKIKIKAPWWRTGWAILGYLCFLTAVILAAYQYYKIKLTRKVYADRLQLNTSISHEIRTPLTLIKGPVSALAKSENLTQNDRTNLALAQKNVEKLENIIAQFIDYQKTGIGKMQMQVMHTNILTVVDDVCASFVPLMKEKNIHFTYTKPSEPVIILHDKDKIEKVLNNLLSNAVKYTNNGFDINVLVKKENKELIIEVSDTGIGIPLNQQRYIFNGYFRADNTINLKETGSGIGLNVVKEFVEMHKGKIEFKSEPNKGSVFTIKLLLENEALLPYLANTDFVNKSQFIPELNLLENEKLSKKSILVVEDNDELRNYLKTEFLKVGYKVLEASNGAIALQVVSKNLPDIIITDVMMPEMNGFQFCAAIKKEIATCHIPVIMLTAIHDKDYLLEGYRSGADDFLRKPFDLSQVIARIENLLQNRMRFRNKIMSVFETENNTVNFDADVEWLKKATSLIVENLQNPDFSVEKLSTLMAMSRPVLFRKFKTLGNESPQQFISKIRLRKSIELLQQRQLNVSQVAFECGFADPKYFSTAFKKQFGKSPLEYLKSLEA
jgi:signal transduction histidine kinase/ligand-binding sensor domain-containing protein/DNA-binding response OmpR family regulator